MHAAINLEQVLPSRSRLRTLTVGTEHLVLGSNWMAEVASTAAEQAAPVINAKSDAPFNSGLPPEVLSRTFELLRDDRELAGSLDWLTVSHVSRRWRAVALGHEYLWTSFGALALSRGLLRVFLSRSGTAPLAVSIGTLSGAKDHILRQAYRQLLSSELHRIQSLVYEDGEATWQLLPAEEVALLLHGPAPTLRVLSLPGSKRSKLLFKEANTLLEFLSKHARNIRQLDLRQFPPQCFPWRSPLASMRSLVLSVDGSVDSGSSQTFDDVLNGLRAMPFLERLSISGFGASHASHGVARDHVHLPRLQVLRLTGNHDRYGYMWRCLRTHPLCAVRIEIPRSFTYPASIRPALVAHLAHSDTTMLREMIVNKNSATILSFSLFPPDHPPDEMETSEFTHPSISIFIAWEQPLEMAPYLPAVQILLSTPIAHLQRLTLDALDFTRVDPEHMAALCPLARSLEVLTLRSFRPHMLSSALLLIGGVYTSNMSMSEFPYPALQKLVLKRCDFDRDVAAPALRDALTRRALAEAKLEEVAFVACGLCSGRFEELYGELVETGLVERIVCEEDEE
ncbi:unnamed protein product [Peniophora sp. CBMAI 1063]|nr:unnamed protein product [Peniophora sp. CBMAI 1063]